MKASISVWLIALLTLCVISELYSSDFNLYYYNSAKLRRFEQSTNYNLTSHHNWQMLFSSRSLEDKRLDFDQLSRNNVVNLAFTRYGKLISHNIQSGYEALSDRSSLESELQPYENKTGFMGYSARFTPLDSLFLEAQVKGFYRREQDRYKADHLLISRGTSERISSGWYAGSPDLFLQLSGSLEQKKMDWEAYQVTNAGLAAYLNSRAVVINCNVNASARSEDLYVLQNPRPDNESSNYTRYDSQDKKSLTTSLNAFIPVSDELNCEIMESYNLSYYRHKVNRTRNSGDYNNLAQVNFTYQMTDNISLSSRSSHNYYIKDLSYINNTRIIDVRTTGFGTAWEYVANDSLLFDYTIELRRTIYPDGDHRLDNDYLNNIYKLGWIAFWKDRIRLANRLIYLEKQEVFINSSLSAYNNTVKGYQWLPECDILLGDSFLLHQDYQLRADYDNYQYKDFTNIRDTFYRKVSASYNLVYDTTPLAAKLTQPKWSQLPYRSRNQEALRMDLGFVWEKTETAAKSGNVYEINGVDERQTLGFTLQKQLGIAIWQAQPKYSWGNWKEYSFLLSTAFQLNRESVAEISINPVGPDLKDLDWRLYCSVNLMF
jgi:hypothetical protein